MGALRYVRGIIFAFIYPGCPYPWEYRRLEKYMTSPEVLQDFLDWWNTQVEVPTRPEPSETTLE